MYVDISFSRLSPSLTKKVQTLHIAGLASVFFKVFWGTKTVSQIPPTVSQNIVTWDHINGERSLKFLQPVS